MYVESTEGFLDQSTSGSEDKHQFRLWNTATYFFHGPTKHYYMGCSIPPAQDGNISYLQTYGIMED